MSKDETGNVYGRLTVVSKADKSDKKKNTYWNCTCSCGGSKVARGSHLRSGNVKSCGCLLHKTPAISTDLSLTRVKSWFVLNKIGRTRAGTFIYRCMCSCGEVRNVSRTTLLTGSGHCGCMSTRGDNAGKNLVYNNYKNGAERRGLVFDLNRDEVWELTQGDCIYCGSAPPIHSLSKKNNPKSRREYTANGIDRVDNEVGYILENCVPCCQFCNLAKGNKSKDDFIAWAKRIATANSE